MLHHLLRGHRCGEIQLHRPFTLLATEHGNNPSAQSPRKRPQPLIKPIVQRHGAVFWGVIAFVLTMVQMGEGFLWEFFGDNYDVATSQLKLSSMMASLAVAAFAMGISLDRESKVTSRNIMVKLGDLSFGIYLLHFIIIRVVLHVLPNVNVFTGIVYGIITLAVTALCVTVASRMLPNRVREWIGFV